MKKICTVCGMGLGSSLIAEMNIKKAIEELGHNLNDFEVTHKNLNSYSPSDNFDIVVCGQDLADSVMVTNGQKVTLDNLLDINEIKEKIGKVL